MREEVFASAAIIVSLICRRIAKRKVSGQLNVFIMGDNVMILDWYS